MWYFPYLSKNCTFNLFQLSGLSWSSKLGIWYVFVMYHLVMKTCILHRCSVRTCTSSVITMFCWPRQSLAGWGWGPNPWCQHPVNVFLKQVKVFGAGAICDNIKLLLVLSSPNLHGLCILWYRVLKQLTGLNDKSKP